MLRGTQPAPVLGLPRMRYLLQLATELLPRGARENHAGDRGGKGTNWVLCVL